MRDLLKTQVVAEDLKRLYYEINNSRRFPFRFRQAFEQYIYKSQQLTETMRKEYHSLTGDNWVAEKFTDWNVYTNILKALRNATYHGHPLALHGTALTLYPGVEFATDSEPLSELDFIRGYRVMESTLFIELPFDEEFLPISAGFPIKNITPGGPTHAFPIKEFISYKLTWRLLEEGVRKATDKAGTTDVVKITLHSYPALVAYSKYYASVLNENRARS
ncbi:hypothetical protein H3222_22430 [Pseudomonas chengduensis]|jgi:hypothetical protein|nr:hypothetical protein [Pseudomonas chengduensis]MBG0847957.1 hypothetical protein [Pseudomonas chengduensis]